MTLSPSMSSADSDIVDALRKRALVTGLGAGFGVCVAVLFALWAAWYLCCNVLFQEKSQKWLLGHSRTPAELEMTIVEHGAGADRVDEKYGGNVDIGEGYKAKANDGKLKQNDCDDEDTKV